MRLSLLLVLFTISFTIFAQEPQFGKYAIAMQPLQLFCRDVPITVERMYNRHTLGITLGHRFSSKLDRNPMQIMRYLAGSEFEFTSPRFKGITLGVNSKYFLNSTRKYYLEGQLFYRHWWFDDRYYTTNFSSGDNYNYLTSGRENVLGLKLLLGKRQSLKQSGTKRPFIYTFFGLGYRLKNKHESGLSGITNYSISTPRYAPYEHDETINTPSFHIGFNLGIEVFKDHKVLQQ